MRNRTPLFDSPPESSGPLSTEEFRSKNAFSRLYHRFLNSDGLELISTTPSERWMPLFSTVAMYTGLILFTRLAGLRSFSKLSNFDFAINSPPG